MTNRRIVWLAWSLFALAGPGCGSDEPPPPLRIVRLHATRVPAEDPTGRCADLADRRVCWGEAPGYSECDRGICVKPRPVPELPSPSAAGWRCAGQGDARECVERDRGVGSFTCNDKRCIQHYPRMPDDGEWECVDMAGAAVCLGGEPAAGVNAAAPDSGWFCGQRRKKSSTARTERVCVDLSPDFPNESSRGWRCAYEREPAFARVCERAREVHQLGDGCGPKAPCVDGSRCVTERCVPPLPNPSCWLDGDCPSGACRFGTCR